MFNSINSWMYKYLAGIHVDERKPGFERILIKPFVDGLDSVKAHTMTKYGEVVVEWRKSISKIELFIQAPGVYEVELRLDIDEYDLENHHNYPVYYNKMPIET